MGAAVDGLDMEGLIALSYRNNILSSQWISLPLSYLHHQLYRYIIPLPRILTLTQLSCFRKNNLFSIHIPIATVLSAFLGIIYKFSAFI